jgi:hypothetical protein
MNNILLLIIIQFIIPPTNFSKKIDFKSLSGVFQINKVTMYGDEIEVDNSDLKIEINLNSNGEGTINFLGKKVSSKPEKHQIIFTGEVDDIQISSKYDKDIKGYFKNGQLFLKNYGSAKSELIAYKSIN